MTTVLVPDSVVHPGTGEVVPLPGHADYDTGTSRSGTVAMLANDRSATITRPAAEGGGLSVVASDITITGIFPVLTMEQRYRLRARAAFGDPDRPRIIRTDGAGNEITGFGTNEIAGFLADGSKVTLRDRLMAGNSPFTGTIGPTGITGISPPLTAAQMSRAVDGTIGRRASGPTFSGAGTAGTGRAKIASVSPDGTAVTFAAGSTSSNATPASGPFNLYAACGFPNGSGSWSVSILGPGTDVSFPLMHWLANGVGADKFATRSGTVGNWTDIVFPASTRWYLEGGLDIGRHSRSTQVVDKAGRVWPNVEIHAWRYTRFKSAGTTRATRATFVQADDTYQDSDPLTVKVDTTVGSDPVVNITPPLGPQVVDRINAFPGLTTIYGAKSGGGAGLFTGGSKTNRADVGTVSADGTTLTLAAGTCTEALTAAPVTIAIPVQEAGKQNWQMFSVAAPGAVGGVERAAMTHDIAISDLNLQLGNGTTAGGAADSRYTPREFWHAFTLGLCDGVTIERLDIRNAWGDAFFLSGSAQAELGASTDTGVMSDNVTIRDTLVAGVGRHCFTNQGDTGLKVDRLTAIGITRLFIDTEMTAAGPITAGASFTDCVIEYGSALWHMGPNAKYGEPPYAVAGVVTASGSKILTVPADMVDSSFMNAPVTGTGIPASTRLRRRLSPTQIEMSKAATANGTTTIEIGLPGVIGDMTFTRLDIISKGGITVTGDAAPRKAKAYYTFDCVFGEDQLRNVTFDTRHDGLVFTTDDVAAIPSTSVTVPGKNEAVRVLGSTPLIESAGSLSQYAHDATNIWVRKVKADGTLELPTWKASSVGDRVVATSFTIADKRTVGATVNGSFLATDKGCDMSGGGLRAGSFMETYTGGKSVAAQYPAASSGGPVTVGGRKRAWSSLVPVRWHGWTISECRNVGPGDWPGGNSLYSAGSGPMIMFPANMDELVVEKCFARAQLGTATTCTTAVANVASLPTSLVTGSNAVWGGSGGYAEVVTSTGVAIIAYTGRTETTLTGCTRVSGTGAIASGARIAKASNPMVGLFTGGTPTVGLGSMGTATNNRWPGAYDNQLPVTPSTTVALTMTMDDPDAARPVATVTATRSDAAPLKGSVQILRDGSIVGSAIFDGTTSTVVTEIWEDQTPGGTYSVQWAGGFDTRGTTEGLTVVDPPPAVPTAWELSTDLPSPQVAGTTINVFGTLTPPEAIDAGVIGIEYPELDPGNIYYGWGEGHEFSGDSFVLPAAGAYSVILYYVPDDPDVFLPSSKELRFVATPVIVPDTTKPVVVTTTPVDEAIEVPTIVPLTVVFSESVTGVVIDVGVPGVLEGSGTTWTFTPADPWPRGVVVRPTVTLAVDGSGNVMDPFSWEFTTVVPQHLAPPVIGVGRFTGARGF